MHCAHGAASTCDLQIRQQPRFELGDTIFGEREYGQPMSIQRLEGSLPYVDVVDEWNHLKCVELLGNGKKYP